ncbi:MAG: aldose 1-epimerase family protein [Bacteroidales bacterium]
MDKSELLKYVGNLSQTGYCRHYTLSDGWGRGMRAADINTGSGLQYTVLPDRGLDISMASYKGVNLVYQTCNGETHPSFYEPEGLGWLRTFGAGLLTTCGLTHLGPPCTDDGEQLGLHGRFSTIPSKQFNDLSDWEGNEYRYKVKAIIEEGFLFGYKLKMEREISSLRGQNSILLTDKITNFGSKPSPYTILYHMNFGFPLLSEETELIIDPLKTIPRDEDAIPGIKDFRSFIKPQKIFKEQVFFHAIKGNSEGEATVTVRNRKIGIAVGIKININQLPYVAQWKMMGWGEYVLGIEPSNVLCKSRKTLREENTLPELQPGESKTNILEFSVNDVQD